MTAASPVILAFDTSGHWIAAALLQGSDVLSSQCEQMARGQGERLMGLLEELLAKAGMGWRDLDLIGVGTGPGNFTGIRISVAAARGLALSLNIPAIGITAFESADRAQAFPYWVAVDAPREQVYLQRFDTQRSEPKLCLASGLSELDAPLIRVSNTSPGQRAKNIGALAFMKKGQPIARPAPLYVRPADAAPPRDPAPRILP